MMRTILKYCKYFVSVQLESSCVLSITDTDITIIILLPLNQLTLFNVWQQSVEHYLVLFSSADSLNTCVKQELKRLTLVKMW